MIATVEPPLTDTSMQRSPPNNGQIFSSQNTLWQKVIPPYSGHLSTKDDKIGPIGVRYMEVPLYFSSFAIIPDRAFAILLLLELQRSKIYERMYVGRYQKL